MRLFIAVQFPEDIKARLTAAADELKKSCRRGNFSRRENMHITLVFLGETPDSRLPQIKAAMSSVKTSPFDIGIGGLGRFRREGGDIYWLGVRDDARGLESIYSQLSRILRGEGFSIEDRRFRAHITLGREVMPYPDFSREAYDAKTGEMSCRVDRISLMLSHRPNGVLTYTDMYSKELE